VSDVIFDASSVVIKSSSSNIRPYASDINLRILSSNSYNYLLSYEIYNIKLTLFSSKSILSYLTTSTKS
jgi:hypothetical protein